MSAALHVLAVAMVALGCCAAFMAAEEGALYLRTRRALRLTRATALRLAVGNAFASALMFGAALALVCYA